MSDKLKIGTETQRVMAEIQARAGDEVARRVFLRAVLLAISAQENALSVDRLREAAFTLTAAGAFRDQLPPHAR